MPTEGLTPREERNQSRRWYARELAHLEELVPVVQRKYPLLPLKARLLEKAYDGQMTLKEVAQIDEMLDDAEDVIAAGGDADPEDVAVAVRAAKELRAERAEALEQLDRVVRGLASQLER